MANSRTRTTKQIATPVVAAIATPTKNYISGKDLTAKPTFNTTKAAALKEASPIVVAVVTNIKGRKKFTNGSEFITAVVDAVAPKFPNMTRKAVHLTVYRALKTYFTA